MADPKGSEITPPDVYLRRRELLKKAGLFTATAGAWGGALAMLSSCLLYTSPSPRD